MKDHHTSKHQSLSGPYWSLLAVFSSLNYVLIQEHWQVIPRWDVVASAAGLFLVVAFILKGKLFPKERPELVKTKRFQKAFFSLTILEVLFQLILPWLLLSYNLTIEKITTDYVKPPLAIGAKEQMFAYMLAPHLFVFQMQIILEMLIFLSGQKHLLFPYTCFANAYRVVPLITWSLRAYNVAPQLGHLGLFQKYLSIFLPLMANTLWIVSSLVFIPFEWMPLITSPG